ncbi:MAG: glycosyl hydrolase family 18 protein [Bacteroidota bacterium]
MPSLLLACLLSAVLSRPAVAQEQGVHGEFQSLYADFERLRPPTPAPAGYTIMPRAALGKAAALRKHVFGYLPYWFRDRWQQIDYTLLSTVAYFSGEAAADGSIGLLHGWPRYAGDPNADASVVSMINAAHARGVRVVLCITNFTAAQIDQIVSTPSATAALIQNSLAAVLAAGGDGVNINFEGVNNASRDALTQFMHSLADTFHTRMPGSQVSCAPTDFDLRYNGGDWDLAALAPFVDLFFVQGYGYAWGSGPTSGPVGLLPNTLFWGGLNITTLIDNVVLTRIGPEKVILGLPHYGYRWPTAGPDRKSTTLGGGVPFYYPDALGYIVTNGRLWDSDALNPWFRYQAAGQWWQGWYDDPESMAYKYQLALDRNVMGVGMWALGMDGPNHDIWDVLNTYFSDSTTALRTPRQPVLAAVLDSSPPAEGRALVRWFANTEPYLGGYRLYLSADPFSFPATPILDETSLDKNSNTALLGGLTLGSVYYVKLVAVDTSRTRVSDTSDTYGVRLGAGPRYLIVDGFDRATASYNLPRHAFNAFYAGPLAAAGRYFDAADNDAIINGIQATAWYAGVIWFLGDESVADRTFNAVEQDSVRAFLERGGNLFVTGSEIGYDLGRAASPNYSPWFYNAYLKAVYAGDQAGSLSFSGAVGSIFEGITGSYGQTYPEDYPDYLSATGGSMPALNYGSAQIAAVQYAGTFGTGTVPGKLVNMGFTFETIASSATRNDLMGRIVDYFEGVTGVEVPAGQPAAFSLHQNFPNPFNPSTVIRYEIPEPERVRLTVYDLLGREVAVLVDGYLPVGAHTAVWTARDVASGVYFCRLQSGAHTGTIKMLVQR